ncbi:MAG: hemerythrin domain-containing protein [Candidatus Babeliales bacterium]|nr:hemerythrin domain-containing protein [Candidatus Babeliales bacterium]
MKIKCLIFTCFILICPPLLCQTPIEEDIPLTEDLMKEHGLLNRVLLIYDKVISMKDIPIEPLKKAVAIIESFIENYHEKNEENYIFPLFEKANIKVELVRTLKAQHIKGREVTAAIKKIIYQSTPITTKNKKRVRSLLKKFINMYRPHEAREDTELYPLVRSLMSKKDFDELSEKFEDSEHELFGPHGFEDFLKKVEDIEKELGIYQLAQFTPKL